MQLRSVGSPLRWHACSGPVSGACVATHHPLTEKALGKIRALVFIDAFVPEDGQCHMDLFPPEYAQLLRQDAQRNGEGYKLTPPPSEGVKLNASDIDWVKAMCIKHPLDCFEQRLDLTDARERVSRRTYILATGWPTPFEKIARRFEQNPAWEVKHVDCGQTALRNSPICSLKPPELGPYLWPTAPACAEAISAS
jgi:hypothetical protein